MHSPFRQGPPPLGPLRNMRYTEFYPLHPGSVRHARQDFRHHVTISELTASVAEAAEVCLSELATNAVLHAEDPRPRRWFHVTCTISGMHRRHLMLGVHDIDSKHIPHVPDVPLDPLAAFDDESEGGRGLLLVAGLATAVRVDHGQGVNGKTIWCRFDLPSSAPTLGARLAPLSRRAPVSPVA